MIATVARTALGTPCDGRKKSSDRGSARESSYALACNYTRRPASSINALQGRSLGNPFCLRCNQELDAGQKSVAVYLFAQTVGIRPRQKSPAHRICFCPQCAVSLAMGPPPEGALNLAAWHMIRDLVSSDPGLNNAAWQALREVAALVPSTGTEGPTRPTYQKILEL